MIIEKKLRLAIKETRFRTSINISQLFNCSNISLFSHSITSVLGSLLISAQFSIYNCFSNIYVSLIHSKKVLNDNQ